MINQLMGFFSTQRQQLKGWELPLAGLLLTAGLAVTAVTVKTTASQHKEQAVNSIAVPSTLETTETQPQEQAIEPPTLPPTAMVETQPQEQAIEPPTLPPTAMVETQPQEQAIEPSTLPSTLIPEAQPQEQAVESSELPPTEADVVPVPQPQKQKPQKQTVAAPSVPSTMKAAAVPQPTKQAVESPAVEKPSIKWNRKTQEERKPTIAQRPNSNVSLSDGTYLYGQSAQPGEIGKEYIVFEARQGKVVGAMYMPSSEYTCFYGTLNSKQMNLTVVNPYNQTSFAHTITREQPTQIAAVGGTINLNNTYDSLTYPHSVGLEGYLPISQVSDNDKQILSNCLNKYQAQVWNH